eukprot:11665175-Alexandrium_andersonii.AAC.1
MPCARESARHRCKLVGPIYPSRACVARPAGKAEISRTPQGQEAEAKGRARLRDEHVWGERSPGERKD